MHFVFPARPSWSWLLPALVILSLSSPLRLAAQGGEPEYFAIRGATVFPVAGPRMERATVVVVKGVITAVGRDAAIPAEAWVIDGKGLTVYPGLFDSYTDIGIQSGGEGAPHQLSRGPEDRPASTPWRTAAVEASLSDQRSKTWRSGGFTTTLSAPRGGIFPGQAAVLDLAGELDGDLVVKSSVAIPISLRPTGGPVSFPASLMGTISYVSQVWLDTAWYSKADTFYNNNPRGLSRPRFDRTDAALAGALRNHAVVLVPANNATQIRRALCLIDRWHVNGVIYGAQMAYETAGDIASAKVPVLVDLKWPEPQKDSDPEDVPALRVLRFRDRAPSSPAALSNAGVTFAFYSGDITSPKEIIRAVRKSIDAGLTPDAALRALTLTPAEIFGVADRLGSIETGKIANLIVTDGDLFNEKTKIETVFVDGHRFEVREPEKSPDDSLGNAAEHSPSVKPQAEVQ